MKKISIYLIDDSEENNFYVEDLLSEFEQVEDVTTFTNPRIALENLIEKRDDNAPLPDLILLDIRMPELDGFEFIDVIDEEFDEFQPIVIMLTSSKHKRDTEAFEKQYIGKEFLNKPLEKGKLQELLEKYF